MKVNDKRIQRKIKRKIKKRLDRNHKKGQSRSPVFSAQTVHYELSDRIEAVHCGGIGAIHMMVKRLGLDQAIDSVLEILKQHQPYHESDHVLNMAYNIIAGGTCLEDIELLRHDLGYMHALGAERIPDPTTAGDFLRRFKPSNINRLMEAVNGIRQRIWHTQSTAFRSCAQLYIDSTIAETTGERKRGMDIAYNGQWGYGPLIISLANTREPLYIENRPASAYSSRNAIHWINKSIALVKNNFKEVWLGGDTAFYLTKGLDQWDDAGVQFVFGCNNFPSLQQQIESVGGWKPFKRPLAYTVKTFARRKRHNIKNRMIKNRNYKQQTLEKEFITEMEYKPSHCKRSYRMVAVKKKIKVTQGQLQLFDQERCFYYITNNRDISAAEVVYRSNDRCDHENDIDQLKNGVYALRMPGHDLVSNWAYTVIASLAWTLKSWIGLLMPHKATGYKIIRMEFRRFLHTFINIPAQIIRSSRQTVFRLAGYMEQAPAFLGFLQKCYNLRL